MIVRFLLIGLFSCFIIACEERPPEVIYSTLEKQDDSKDYEDWVTSEYHPEHVFEAWHTHSTDGKAICTELAKLTPADLSVFENQIRDSKYAEMLSACQKALISKLDEFWRKEKSELPLPVLDFKFETNVISLDDARREKQTDQFLKAKQVLLTFDDGPHPEYTDKLLKILQQVNAKGVFFLLGKNVEQWPDRVSKEANAGHTIASHTHDHKCIGLNANCASINGHGFSLISAQEQVEGGIASILKVLGWIHPFFRFPYGATSSEVQKYIYERGFFDVHWTIDSSDWKQMSLNSYYASLVSKISEAQRGTILFHDIQKKTIEVMGPFLKYLHKNNYTIVVVTAKPVKNFKRD